jgi:MFS family permease
MPSSIRGRYAPMLILALTALIPYILVASAAPLYREGLVHDLHTSKGALMLVEQLSVAGYAFGALLAGDLIQRVRQRNLFCAGQMLLVIGWALAAIGTTLPIYGAGFVLAGFATGTLLVIALPPVMRRFPPSHLPYSAASVNIAFFGAVAAGPLLGGIVASAEAWHVLYAVLAGVGALNGILALISLPRIEAFNPDLPFDFAGIGLGLAATVLPFWASGELGRHGFGTLVVALPLGVGLAALVAMLLLEYREQEALSPVEKMWNTFPIIGTLLAMFGGAAFFTFLELATQYRIEVAHASALAAGMTFWPQFAGAMMTAVILGLVFRTRYLSLLGYAGMALLVAGGALLILFHTDDAQAQILAGVGLLGLGAGATVSPGLFLAGLALPSTLLGRIFALVELVRSVANFMLAPVMIRVARNASLGGPETLDSGGLHYAMWITLLMTLGGVVTVVALHVLSGAGLPRPDLDRWLGNKGPAIPSPPLLARLRRRTPDWPRQ